MSMTNQPLTISDQDHTKMSNSSSFCRLLAIASIIIALSNFLSHGHAQQVEVNLIHPLIVAANFESSSPRTPFEVDLKFRTRAAEYAFLLKDNSKTGTAGKLTRVSALVKPKPIGEQALIYNDYSSPKEFLSHELRAGTTLQKLLHDADLVKYICHAKTVIKDAGKTTVFCHRHKYLYVCIGANKCVELRIAHDVPVSAIAARSTKSDPNISYYDVALFANTGYLSILRLDEIKVGTVISTLGLQLYSLQEIEDAKLDSNSWVLSGRFKYLAPQHKLVKILQKSESLQLTASYLETVAPIKRGGLEALCYSDSTRYNYEQTPGLLARCTNTAMTILSPDSAAGSDHTLMLAMHQVEYNNVSYSHVVTLSSSKDADKSAEYTFCRNNDQLGLGQDKKGCETAAKIFPAPDDIVGFQYQQCNVTIVFYSPYYAVLPANVSILHAPTRELQPIQNLRFPINAAYAQGSTLYFFTYANSVLKVDAIMDRTCRTLNINWNSMVELRADDHILHHWTSTNRELPLGPGVVDYRELKQGDNDTFPSVQPWVADLEPNQQKGSTSIPLLAIGLILVVSLIVGLTMCYLYFFRKSEPESANLVTIKSSMRDNADSLMANTVRSGQISQLLQPSPGSTAPSTSPPSTTSVQMRAAQEASRFSSATGSRTKKSPGTIQSSKSNKSGTGRKSKKSKRPKRSPSSRGTKSGQSKSPFSSKVSGAR